MLYLTTVKYGDVDTEGYVYFREIYKGGCKHGDQRANDKPG